MSNLDTTTDANAPPLPPVAVGKGDSPAAGGPKSLDDLTGGSDAQYDAITKADLKLTKEKIGAEGGMAAIQKRQDDAYAQRQERMLGAEGATMDDLKPWNAEKEMAKRETNLWEQFGSPGFVISMLASAFTAMPMNSALNAGAAAMNAINQGKMEDYHKAFDAWKENSNLTLKRLGIEEHEFNQIGDLRSKNMESWRAQATALAARFNDKRLQILLENGMDAQALDAIDAKAKSKVELADARQRLLQNDIRMGLINADPDYKSGDPKKMAAAIHRADAAMQGDDAKMTPDQRFQLMWHQQNPDGTYQEFSDAYGKFKRGERPDVSARYDEIARHNKAMEDVAAGRTTVAQAKQDEINRHNQNMEDIAAGRVATGYSREEEIERHNRAMEDLGSQKVDVSREAETGRNTRADLSSTTRLELNKLSTQARKEIEAAKLQVDAIKIDHQDRRTGAQIEGSYERAQLSDKTRREIAGMNNDAREELQKYLEGGRDKRATEAATARQTARATTKPALQDIPAAIKRLEDARGTAILPEQKAIIDATFSSGGVNQAPKIAAVESAIGRMESAKKAGKPLSDAQQTEALNNAVSYAQASYGRSGGSYAARVDSATSELQQQIPQAIETGRALPREGLTKLNEWVQAFESGTSDPKYYDALSALWAVENAYARAINPTGVPREGEKAELRAQKMISLVTDEVTYETVLRRMMKEANSSQVASHKVMSGTVEPVDIEALGPLPVNVGSNTSGDPEGTKYKKAGWLWEKQGGLLVPTQPIDGAQ